MTSSSHSTSKKSDYLLESAKRRQENDDTLSGTNLERAGDHNQRVTLQAIRAHGPITRTDLAEITGLTAPAIANITKRLMGENLVLKAGRLIGGRGQPATKLEINPQGAYSIGLNIDRDHITLVALDFTGSVCARTCLEIAFPSPQDVLKFFKQGVEDIIAQKSIIKDRLVGLGIGIPDDMGKVHLPGQPEDYNVWQYTDISELLSPVLDVPVFIENDAAAAAIGELQFGHGLRSKSFFYVLITAGIGGGLVINGQYFRGANGRSGEIGFLPDMGASGIAQSDDVLGDAVLMGRLFEQLRAKGIKAYAPDDLTHLPPEGLAVLDTWIEHAAAHLSPALLTLGIGINPEAIYIGGRLPHDIIARLCQVIMNKFDAVRHKVPQITPVETAILATDATAIGAGILPFNHRLLPNREVLMKTA